MSSPIHESENAASHVPLSSSASPCPRDTGSADGGGEPIGYQQHPLGESQQDTEHVSPRAPVSVDSSQASWSSNGTVHAASADKDDGPRGLAATPQRLQGPSLLTQALANARGFPKQSQPSETSTTQESGGSGSHRSAQAPLDPSGVMQLDRDIKNRSPSTITATTTSPDNTRNEDISKQHGDKESLTSPSPQSSSAKMAASTIMPPTFPIPGRDAASVPSFTAPYLPNARDMLLEQRYAPERSLRRSSISCDVDRNASTTDWISAEPLSIDHDTSTTPTRSNYLTGDIPLTAPQTLDNPASELLQRLRPPPPDHRYTLGPEKTEKIWSIGSGEGNEEDGLVEKSVAEAMAGVEHNTRSRKASYSLRFFKEGLPPDDKSRRRGEHKGSHKDKLPATQEEASETPQPGQTDEERRPRTPRTPRGHDSPSPRLSSHSGAPDSKGYFDIGQQSTTQPVTPSLETSATPGDNEDAIIIKPLRPEPELQQGQKAPTPALATKTVEGHRESGDSTEVGEYPDDVDAEESGEEKISSAVFVPHHELGESRAHNRDAAHVGSGLGPRPRSLSQDEAHPWLVKADEPEPEPKERDENKARLARFRSRESLASARGELASDISDGLSREADQEINNHLAQALARSGIQHVEVDNDDEDEHQPLEAIELIPYKHQVGGHTTLWRFSRRAVCKQLNNRENEFYEIIERYHRDLLSFLPRYVLIRPAKWRMVAC